MNLVMGQVGEGYQFPGRGSICLQHWGGEGTKAHTIISHAQRRTDPTVPHYARTQRIFFRDAGEAGGRRPVTQYIWLLAGMSNMLLGMIFALILCCVVYPVLSIALWCRGLCGVYHYTQRLRGNKSPWQRRQINLGEEDEWDVARRHAIRRNIRLCKEIPVLRPY